MTGLLDHHRDYLAYVHAVIIPVRIIFGYGFIDEVVRINILVVQFFAFNDKAGL